MQETEKSRQLEKLLKIEEQLSTQFSIDRIQRLFAETMKRQQKLTLKADTVLQSLMEHHEPQISDYERKYFSELNRLRDIVMGERGYEGRIIKVFFINL